MRDRYFVVNMVIWLYRNAISSSFRICCLRECVLERRVYSTHYFLYNGRGICHTLITTCILNENDYTHAG